MLYTGKGDDGKTGLFGCSTRVSKNSLIGEALGSMDEVNSSLGFAKLHSREEKFQVGTDGEFFHDIVHKLQGDLFIIQAELAGTPMTIEEGKVRWMEEIIKNIEQELPPIRSFFISGGTELSSFFDFSRTLARRAERRVVAVQEDGERKMGQWSLAYLNRLSSILYALARLSNHKSGIKEDAPDYR